MNKLTYKRINDNLITIDLHNGYSIIAILSWKSKEQHYNVQLMLKENTIDKWDLMEKAGHLIFKTNYKFIYKAILKRVATFLEEGFFDYYIQRFEYECNCFDRGYELFEKERMGVE